jgi:hypothetical protein
MSTIAIAVATMNMKRPARRKKFSADRSENQEVNLANIF